MASTDTQELLPIGEAARLVGVSVDTLRNWSNSGRVTYIRTPSGHRRYRASDLTGVMVEHPGGAA